MGRQAILTVLCLLEIKGSLGESADLKTLVLDNEVAESDPWLYRNVPIYASSVPYGAYSIQIPTFVTAPKASASKIVPVKEAFQNAGYLRDSYGNRFAPQAFTYKTTFPQQFVQLQELPAHLSQPLVAAAPNYQFKQPSPFAINSHYTLPLQATQQSQRFSAPQKVVYTGGNNNFGPSSLTNIPGYGQPKPQQQSASNHAVYANSHPQQQFSGVKQGHQFQRIQELPKDVEIIKEIVSRNKESDQLKDSPAKETSITTVVNGQKTVVNLETKPVHLLDLTLLEPLKFDNPLVPQVQHFLPRISQATYQKLPNVNELIGQKTKSRGAVRKKSNKKKSKRPSQVSNKKHNSVNPTVKDIENATPEISYEINSPNYKETYNEKAIRYNKETQSEPVHYSYGSKTEAEPVHYSYAHNTKEPLKIKDDFYHNNGNNPKHLIYNFNSEEQPKEQKDENPIPPQESDNSGESVESEDEEPVDHLELQEEHSKANQIKPDHREEEYHHQPEQKTQVYHNSNPEHRPEEYHDQKHENKAEEHPQNNPEYKPEQYHQQKPEHKTEEYHHHKPEFKAEEYHHHKPEQKAEEYHHHKPEHKAEEYHHHKPEHKAEEYHHHKPEHKAEEYHYSKPEQYHHYKPEYSAEEYNNHKSENKEEDLHHHKPQQKAEEYHRYNPQHDANAYNDRNPEHEKEELHHHKPEHRAEDYHNKKPEHNAEQYHYYKPEHKGEQYLHYKPKTSAEKYHHYKPEHTAQKYHHPSNQGHHREVQHNPNNYYSNLREDPADHEEQFQPNPHSEENIRLESEQKSANIKVDPSQHVQNGPSHHKPRSQPSLEPKQPPKQSVENDGNNSPPPLSRPHVPTHQHIEEKSHHVVIQEEAPEEMHALREKVMAEMIEAQENNEEDFEKAYKNAAFGFPAYHKDAVDTEKEIYSPQSYVAPRDHDGYDVEHVPFQQYQNQRDEFPKTTRLSYKDARDKTKEDYYLDFAVSRPESLTDRYKNKVDYYKLYKQQKPQFANNDGKKKDNSKYTVGQYVFKPVPEKNTNKAFAPYKAAPQRYEYDYSKGSPRDSSAYASRPLQQYKMKTHFVEPQFQYGFEPITMPLLLDSELATMASNDSPESEKPVMRKKVYKENWYIKKTQTSGRDNS